MIDLKKVNVDGQMLLDWQKHTGKDPLSSTDFSTEDILYAYYLMAKSINKDITPEKAYKDIKTSEIIKVMKAFFPALASPQEILNSLPK